MLLNFILNQINDVEGNLVDCSWLMKNFSPQRATEKKRRATEYILYSSVFLYFLRGPLWPGISGFILFENTIIITKQCILFAIIKVNPTQSR